MGSQHGALLQSHQNLMWNVGQMVSAKKPASTASEAKCCQPGVDNRGKSSTRRSYPGCTPCTRSPQRAASMWAPPPPRTKANIIASATSDASESLGENWPNWTSRLLGLLELRWNPNPPCLHVHGRQTGKIPCLLPASDVQQLQKHSPNGRVVLPRKFLRQGEPLGGSSLPSTAQNMSISHAHNKSGTASMRCKRRLCSWNLRTPHVPKGCW